MSWPDIQAFLAVAQEGQLSRAAERLGTSVPTLHRRLAALEVAVGVDLFVRGNAGHRLTEAGERLIGSATAIETAASAFHRTAATIRTAPEGRLRIAAPEMIVRYLLAPRVDTLRRTSPRLVPEFISAPDRARLVERDADLAVRLADPGEPSLIARRIGKVRFELYAPDPMRAIHGAVRTADHWLPIPWIGWNSEFASLPIARCVANLLPIESQVGAANALPQQLVLARTLGAALVLPSFLARYEPGLRRVEAAPSPLLEEPLWLVVNQEFRGTPAAKTATAWIKANLIDLR